MVARTGGRGGPKSCEDTSADLIRRSRAPTPQPWHPRRNPGARAATRRPKGLYYLCEPSAARFVRVHRMGGSPPLVRRRPAWGSAPATRRTWSRPASTEVGGWGRRCATEVGARVRILRNVLSRFRGSGVCPRLQLSEPGSRSETQVLVLTRARGFESRTANGALWRSWLAREAHNLKVAGSIPANARTRD